MLRRQKMEESRVLETHGLATINCLAGSVIIP